ncbi:hypothetical protein SERIO_v1c03690 [Spiroplasma eriocheiris]|uniref:Transmembrane protein n=2 Tax=Spiroplasma eriocheiris TaxID=315358 RepID=A0A0H3XJE1_9MOLU|nr:hypothetical protein SERIO_v1c03690 [Spiroplasma eriocheiris]
MIIVSLILKNLMDLGHYRGLVFFDGGFLLYINIMLDEILIFLIIEIKSLPFFEKLMAQTINAKMLLFLVILLTLISTVIIYELRILINKLAFYQPIVENQNAFLTFIWKISPNNFIAQLHRLWGIGIDPNYHQVLQN